MTVGVIFMRQRTYWLDHMRVTAYNVVNAYAVEPLFQLLLVFIRLSLELCSPVHAGNYAVSLELACTYDIGLDLCGVYQIDYNWLCHGYAVGIIGVVENGNPDSVLFKYERVESVPFSLIAVCAQMWYSKAVKRIKSADESAGATIHAMVVGGQEDVKTGITDRRCQFIGGTELRITSVGRAAQRGLKVADSNIGCLNLRGYLGETAAIVICSVGFAGSFELLLMLHYISGKIYGDTVYGLGL